MDGDSENCCRLHGLRHEQREAQHGGGGGGDDGANPHPNLRLEYKTIQFDILGMSVSQKMTLGKKFFFQTFSILLYYFGRSH